MSVIPATSASFMVDVLCLTDLTLVSSASMICYIPQGFYSEYVASLVEVNVQFSSDTI